MTCITKSNNLSVFTANFPLLFKNLLVTSFPQKTLHKEIYSTTDRLLLTKPIVHLELMTICYLTYKLLNPCQSSFIKHLFNSIHFPVNRPIIDVCGSGKILTDV